MPYVGLIGQIVLALTCGLGLLIATADDAEIASLDPSRPATLLPLLTSRLHAVPAYVCQGSPMESHAGSAIVSQQRR